MQYAYIKLENNPISAWKIYYKTFVNIATLYKRYNILKA